MRDPTETPIYYETELLRAEHDLRLFQNNAAAFQLRKTTAKTTDAWDDARGSEQYWLNRAFVQEARVRDLKELLQASQQP